jgi:hypothetical protein
MAYVKLRALRLNLPDKGRVNERIVAEMHESLDLLSTEGFDVAAFRIPDTDLRPVLRSDNPRTGEKHYSEERFVDSILLRTKLDAILMLFDLKVQKQTVGFAP